MVLQSENYCIKCESKYKNIELKWCIPCQINYSEKYFTNWNSGNEKIDNLIQEMQLKIDNSEKDIVFEWISYNQFNDVIEISNDKFATTYSAIWKDGPLYFSEEKYTRKQNERFALKCLYNSQNFTDEFLNKV